MLQQTLIVQITDSVYWLKLTLLLKIECWETHIYMKTSKVNAASSVVGKEKYVVLTKIVKLTQEYEEACEVALY